MYSAQMLAALTTAWVMYMFMTAAAFVLHMLPQPPWRIVYLCSTCMLCNPLHLHALQRHGCTSRELLAALRHDDPRWGV